LNAAAPMRDDEQRRRVAWQCRRGMLELDELLQAYFDRRYVHASARERDSFARLLALPDQELCELLLHGGRCTDAALNHVIERIRSR
jgi:antitoxin CptB